jgi:hypothetical protein
MALRDDERTTLIRQPRLGAWGRAALAIAAGALLAEGARHLSFAAPAEAQRSVQGGILNPADQRNEMIKQLKALNERLGKIERAMSSEAIDVNVLSMPSGGPAASGD